MPNGIQILGIAHADIIDIGQMEKQSGRNIAKMRQLARPEHESRGQASCIVISLATEANQDGNERPQDLR
jgi:hypothetical protein